MNQDDLKLYSILVGNGSGCFFQPMTEDYTYILTAKHLFFIEQENDRGETIQIELEDNEEVEIWMHQKVHSGWEEVKIPFTLKKNNNYYPHKNADIAILKVNHISDYNSISVQNQSYGVANFELCGSPISFRDNNEGERYTSHAIERFMATGNYIQGAQIFGTLNQNDIEGMSGGGILSILNDNIYLIGIQSKMASRTINQAGQIGFVPMKYFDDIVDYPEYDGELEKLFPNYMKNFTFLKNESFKLEVDDLDEQRIEAIRITLRNKALEIVHSNVTPYGIRELFKERLLLNGENSEHLSTKNIWIAWLEFLTIMNIVKFDKIQIETLSEIFNSFRLKYANVDDWTSLIRTDLLNSDYLGLKPDSTVVVSTNKIPKSNFIFPKGKLINIARVYDKSGFRTDKGIDPFSAFNFVHLEYFKTKCIVEQLDKYENILDENELLIMLKDQYDELFR